MKHSLQKHGYHVFGFTDPLLALEHLMINSKDYSLVISDIRMPVMNGLEFVKKVREILPSIKILLMSAFDIKDSQFSKICCSKSRWLYSKADFSKSHDTHSSKNILKRAFMLLALIYINFVIFL